MIYGQSIIEGYTVLSEIDTLLESTYVEEGMKERFKELKEERRKYLELEKKIKSEADPLVRQGLALKQVILFLSVMGGLSIGAPFIAIPMWMCASLVDSVSAQLTEEYRKEHAERLEKYKERVKKIREKNKNKELDSKLEKLEKAL